ncbi:hypothetical protein ACT3TZ_14520 [Brachybacterium sp. AOP25-B2-12]|uniref:hypothetical protein n=1 Tax=Brachybacterium sp. AOP25-B2-12 TaxID=3457710 RepID=UPI0040331AFB
MPSGSWPREPSPLFSRWGSELERWKGDHDATSGRRHASTRVVVEELYEEHGGIHEATTLGDLEWVAHTEADIRRSQRVAWDTHAEQVRAAAREGGAAGAAEALRESTEWIRRLDRDGKPVLGNSPAVQRVARVMDECPDNPLIRAEEVWGLWESLELARGIAVSLRDELLLELEEQGCPRRQMSRALGWSDSRVRRRLERLHDARRDLRQRIRQGDVGGVVDIEGAPTGPRRLYGGPKAKSRPLAP